MNCEYCNNIHRLYECPMATRILNTMKNIYQLMQLSNTNENDHKLIYTNAIHLRFHLYELKIVSVKYICSTAYRWRRDRLINQIYEFMTRYNPEELGLEETEETEEIESQMQPSMIFDNSTLMSRIYSPLIGRYANQNRYTGVTEQTESTDFQESNGSTSNPGHTYYWYTRVPGVIFEKFYIKPILSINELSSNIEMECPICYDEKILLETNCSHKFCFECVKMVLENHNKNCQLNCALCRSEIKSISTNNSEIYNQMVEFLL